MLRLRVTSCGCGGEQREHDEYDTDEEEENNLTDTEDEVPQNRASADETGAEESGPSAAKPRPSQVESNQASASAAEGTSGACLGPSTELPGSAQVGGGPKIDHELTRLAAAIGALSDDVGTESSDVRQEPSDREGAADGEAWGSAGGEDERLRGGESDSNRQQAAMQARDRGEAVVRGEGDGFQALLQHLSSNLSRSEAGQQGGEAAVVRRAGPAEGEDLRASGRVEVSQGDSTHFSSSSGSNTSARSDSAGMGGDSHSSLSLADSEELQKLEERAPTDGRIVLPYQMGRGPANVSHEAIERAKRALSCSYSANARLASAASTSALSSGNGSSGNVRQLASAPGSVSPPRLAAQSSRPSSPVREDRKKCKLRIFKRKAIEVADCIGKGAYGSVWQAYLLDQQSQEQGARDCVVVKVVWPDTDLDPAEVAEYGTPIKERMLAFRREIEMMELAGRHPNIINILGATRDSRVIVFEQAWTDLQALIRKQSGGVALPHITKWLYDILVGVEYLHSVHMVHRDLKPANILVFQDMTAKIGDFGMARTFSPRSRMAVSREICTLWYRAPELLMGSLTYDVKVDEWAVGCLTIEMLCGQNAMPGQNEDRSGRTCSCGQVAHLNHNLDQLVLVFTLLGSPPHSFLQRYPCYEHFEDWDDTECSLSLFLHQIGVFNRANPMSRAPPVGAPVEFAELIANDWSKTACSERNWMEVLKALLCIDPDKRATATQVLEMDLFRLANEHMPSRTPALLNMRSTQASGAHQPPVTAPLSYSHADLSSLMPEQPSGASRQSSLPLQPPLPVEETFTYGSYGASGFREGRRMQLRSSSQSRSPARVASGGSSRSPARVPRVHGAAGQASVRSSAASSVSNSPRSVRGHSPGRDAGASAAAAGGGSSRPAGTGQQASSGFERGRRNVREVLSAVRSRTGRRPPA